MSRREVFRQLDRNSPYYHMAIDVVGEMKQTLIKRLGKNPLFEDYMNYLMELYSNQDENCVAVHCSYIQDEYMAMVEILKISDVDVTNYEMLYHQLYTNCENYELSEKDNYIEKMNFICEQVEYRKKNEQNLYADRVYDYLKHIKIEKVIKELHDIIYEVPKLVPHLNLEVSKQLVEKKDVKESSFSFAYVWGAVALFFVILPFIIKYPYVIGIVMAVGLVYLIKRQ